MGWSKIPASGGGSGDVVGAASAVDENLAVFDGTTGKIIKDGGAPIDLAAVTTDIIHTTDDTGDLGSQAKQFSEIYGGDIFSKNTPVFNAKAWGLVGNGSTDDSTAYAAMAAAVVAAGGVAYFPAGTYKIDTTYSWGGAGTADFIRIIGDGKDISILDFSGSAQHGLVTLGYGCHIRDLQIKTQKGRQAFNIASATTNSYPVIKDLYCNQGSAVFAGYSGLIENLFIDGNTSSGNGLDLTANHVIARNVQVTRWSTGVFQRAINYCRFNNWFITNNSTYNYRMYGAMVNTHIENLYTIYGGSSAQVYIDNSSQTYQGNTLKGFRDVTGGGNYAGWSGGTPEDIFESVDAGYACYGFQKNVVQSYRAVTAAASTTENDYIIGADTATTGAFTLTLESDTVQAGRIIIVKDIASNFNTANLTIATEGSENIDTSASNLTCSTQDQVITLFCDGTDWFLI